MNALTAHIGHRAYLKDERHLRCVDCTQTLVLPAVAGPTSTSTKHPRASEACPRHPGQWPQHCAGCRAEALEATEPNSPAAIDHATHQRGLARVRAALNRQESA